jgi:hypothetical protein
MAEVPDVQAILHGGDADGAGGGVAGRGSRENTERLGAEGNLASSLVRQGKDAEAEPMFRRLHEVTVRMHGAEHPDTLASAGNLAFSLTNQGKCADAERIQREVHEMLNRVLGAQHPDTLTSAGNLAMSLWNQGKYADAGGSSARCLERKSACSAPSIRPR